MDHFLTIFLLALAANLDNLIVGIYYGTKKTNLSIGTNFLIALVVGTGSLLAMLFGRLIARVTSPHLANYLGSFLLIFAGIWIVIQERRRIGRFDALNGSQNLFYNLNVILKTPAYADLDGSGHIDCKEGGLLGIALTLNNLAACLGAGVSGLEPFLAAGLIAFLSLLLLSLGIKFGHFCASRGLKKYAGEIAGLLLAITGLYELFVS